VEIEQVSRYSKNDARWKLMEKNGTFCQVLQMACFRAFLLLDTVETTKAIFLKNRVKNLEKNHLENTSGINNS